MVINFEVIEKIFPYLSVTKTAPPVNLLYTAACPFSEGDTPPYIYIYICTELLKWLEDREMTTGTVFSRQLAHFKVSLENNNNNNYYS